MIVGRLPVGDENGIGFCDHGQILICSRLITSCPYLPLSDLVRKKMACDLFLAIICALSRATFLSPQLGTSMKPW